MKTAALSLCALVLFLACRGKASESEVARLKAADKPGVIAEILVNPKTEAAVRLRAARALVELAADAHFADALKKLDAGTREQLARELGPELTAKFFEPYRSELDKLFASSDLASQVLAKDFLGLLVLAGDRPTAQRAGEGLVRWFVVDFPTRAALGKVSGLEITKVIGSPALPALHSLLAAPTPRLDLLTIAKIVAGIGDAAGIAQAAELVGRAALAQGPKIPERTLRTLFTLGGPRAAEHLGRIAANSKLSFPSRRAAAEELRALGHGAARDIAAKLAFTEDEDQFIRESCLVYLEKVCDASCAPMLEGLWRTLSVPGLIFESASALVKIGGVKTLGALLAKLPAGRGYTAKAIEGLADDLAKNLAASALAVLRTAAKEARGPGLLVAFRGLAKLGNADDAALLEKRKGDGTVPEGWRFKSTLGKEAERAATDIRKRK